MFVGDMYACQEGEIHSLGCKLLNKHTASDLIE
jgi:hypothetical protein